MNELRKEIPAIGLKPNQLGIYIGMIYNMIFFQGFCYANSKDVLCYRAFELSICVKL